MEQPRKCNTGRLKAAAPAARAARGAVLAAAAAPLLPHCRQLGCRCRSVLWVLPPHSAAAAGRHRTPAACCARRPCCTPRRSAASAETSPAAQRGRPVPAGPPAVRHIGGVERFIGCMLGARSTFQVQGVQTMQQHRSASQLPHSCPLQHLHPAHLPTRNEATQRDPQHSQQLLYTTQRSFAAALPSRSAQPHLLHRPVVSIQVLRRHAVLLLNRLHAVREHLCSAGQH